MNHPDCSSLGKETPEKVIELNVFEVTFGCGNCGDEWGDSYPPRTKVKENTPSDVRYYDMDCDNMGMMGCDCCDIIICPTCELRKHVTIDDRNPIEEDE